MRNIYFLILLFFSFLVSSQETDNYQTESNQHSIEYFKLREFKNKPSSKYNGSDFKYNDSTKKPKDIKPLKPSASSIKFFESLANFMTYVFPYLLAIIVVLIIVKSFLANNTDFWNFKRKKIKKLNLKVLEEEQDNIELNDYEILLKNALEHKNYRLATRCYYMLVMQKMTAKELIKFDKDKTNSEYLFDLKNDTLKTQFSYLLYLYDYVWYGEFNIDEVKFSIIENNYKSFIKKL